MILNRCLLIFIFFSFKPTYSAIIRVSSTNINSGDIFKVSVKREPGDGYIRVYQNGVRRVIYPVKGQSNWYHFFAGYDVENKMNWVTIKVISEVGVFKKNLLIKTFSKKSRPEGVVNIKSSKKKVILEQKNSSFAEENAFFHRFFSKEKKRQHWTKNWIYPVREVTVSSVYGKLRKYNNGRISFHRGVDFSAPIGTLVRSANNGYVVYSGEKKVRGHVVVIDHGMGIFTTYWHLHKRNVRAGEFVRKGQIIGQVGQTGLASGPHLHWGVRVLNTPVNGLKLLEIK